MTPAEKAKRTLADASLDNAYLRISCEPCGHAVARLPHVIPNWPEGLLSELAQALSCSKCGAKKVTVDEVAWCEEAHEIIKEEQHLQKLRSENEV